jgi:hypothetical protein
MNLLYEFVTDVGPFYIGQSDDGTFHPTFEDESLGSYAKAWQAAEDLAGGHTISAGAGIDTASLGIPADLSEWRHLQATDPARE